MCFPCGLGPLLSPHFRGFRETRALQFSPAGHPAHLISLRLWSLQMTQMDSWVCDFASELIWKEIYLSYLYDSKDKGRSQCKTFKQQLGAFAWGVSKGTWHAGCPSGYGAGTGATVPVLSSPLLGLGFLFVYFYPVSLKLWTCCLYMKELNIHTHSHTHTHTNTHPDIKKLWQSILLNSYPFSSLLNPFQDLTTKWWEFKNVCLSRACSSQSRQCFQQCPYE